MRPATILAVAIVPALLLAGCGSRQDVARNAITQGIINGSAYKQEMIAHLISRPETKTTMTIEESDKIARLLIADRAIAYGVTGLSQADRDAIAARYAALPTGAEYTARKPAVPAANATTTAPEPVRPAAQPAAAATAKPIPVLDHRDAHAARLEAGTAATSITGAWTPVTAGVDDAAAPIAVDLRGIHVGTDGRIAVAWGPTHVATTVDGGATWTRRKLPAQRAAVVAGRIVVLDADGGLVDASGFILCHDLPRAYDLVVGRDRLAVLTKSTVQWLTPDAGGGFSVAAKQPKPADAVTTGILADGGIAYVGRGCAGTVLAQDGAIRPMPTVTAPGLIAAWRPGPDYVPARATPRTGGDGDDLQMVDDGIRANLAAGPSAGSGYMLLSVSVDAVLMAETNTGAPRLNARGSDGTAGRSPAADSLPAGTRAVAVVGDHLVAVGRTGMFRHPR